MISGDIFLEAVIFQNGNPKSYPLAHRAENSNPWAFIAPPGKPAVRKMAGIGDFEKETIKGKAVFGTPDFFRKSGPRQAPKGAPMSLYGLASVFTLFSL